MRGQATRGVVVGAFAAALGACSAMSGDTGPPPEPNIMPTNYKQEIIDTMMRILPDATNVRGAFITDPFLSVAPGGKDQRYIVCIRYNGRDASRQYMGSKDRVGTFFAGHLNQLVEAGNEQCAKAPFKPFPELEKLCQAKTCD
jgi:hypothetical protein